MQCTSLRFSVACRYKDDQERETKEAAEKALLASMTEDERRRWELANPKVPCMAYVDMLCV